MGLGKQIRLRRIFSHPSGNICSIAIDHFSIYDTGLPPGLRRVEASLDAIVAAQPSAVTMHKGIARALWGKYAGQLPLILQTSAVRPDDSAHVQLANVEEALLLGADALAVVAFVRNATEASYLKTVADCVRDGMRYELPIICHIYPRDKNNNIIYTPEDIAWAVRCAVEVGVDVVKVPYCGDIEAHRQIVQECPIPMVAAGGPKTPTFRGALQVLADAVSVGVLGGTVGRNVWGSTHITDAVHAYKSVILDRKSVDEVMQAHPALANQ
jgi:class I fructose-bisphosphate aldolase